MISKISLQSIINKYHLGVNPSVSWHIDNGNFETTFASPSSGIVGKVWCVGFPLEDGKVSIYDTKKLANLISICSGDLLLELEKTNKVNTKLKISDENFSLNFALSIDQLIPKIDLEKVVNVPPDWDVVLDLTPDNIENLIKAKSALSGVDNMLITTTKDLDGEIVSEFIFGDEEGHNNKITYQIRGVIKEGNDYLKLPYNSDIFKTILYANKDQYGELYLSKEGLMKLTFSGEIEEDKHEIQSEYYLIRKADIDF